MDITFWLTVVLLVGLLLVSVPIGVSLGIAGFVGLLVITDVNVAMGTLETAVSGTAASFVLVTIPMFLLMANIMAEAGIIRDIYAAAMNWLSRLRGGLAYSSIAAGVLLGSVSGATTASAAAMSRVAIPSMQKYGYSDTLSGSSVALGASLSVLIPPSVMLIIYGSATQTSVGALLVAGLVPGLLVALLLLVAIFIWVKISPSMAPEPYSTPWKTRFTSLLGILPFVTLVLAILVLLYSGIITPTEIGAIGALLALLLGIGMRRLPFRAIGRAVLDTLKGTAMIFVIMAGATIFARYLTHSRVPQEVAEVVLGLEMPPWAVIVAIIAVYLILSMLMDELPLMLMTLPVTLPIVLALGYDPIWFGIITMLSVIMGLITPPVGMLVFVVSASSGIKSGTIFRGTAVLLLPVLVAVALVLIWPELVLWLPSLMS